MSAAVGRPGLRPRRSEEFRPLPSARRRSALAQGSQGSYFFEYLDRNKKKDWACYYIDHTHLQRLLLRCESWELWCSELRDEAEKKVGRHILGHARVLEAKLHQVRERASVAAKHTDPSKRRASLVHLEKDLSNVYSNVKQLNDFASHNFSLGLRLIDEFVLRGGPEALAGDALQKFRDTRSHSADLLSGLEQQVDELNETLGVDAIGTHLCAESQTRHDSAVHSFLLGAMIMCWIFTAVLLWSPAKNPEFNRAAYAGAIPVFRCSFMLGLLLWMAGCVVLVFEKYSVNYLMILDVDPSIALQSSSIFTLAQVQTLIFTVLFLTYIMDFKFGLLFETHLAYEIYPLLQAVLSAALWLLPWNILPWMRCCRGHLASCFVSVVFALHPNFQVTFASNLMGDVIMSFAKPLKDAVYTGCYLSQVATGGALEALRIAEVCHPVRGYVGTFLILILPSVFRLMQCLRRYMDTRASVPHLMNAGKYLVSLLVSAVAFVSWETRFNFSPQAAWSLLLTSYTVATAYSLFWDIYMDWGLLPDLPHSWRLQRKHALYPPWVYRALAVADVFGRMTWATNLMPNGVIIAGKVEREIFSLTISSVEVVRRALWTVLRVEHEQLANASKYRNVLWLPPLSRQGAEDEPDEMPLPASAEGPISSDADASTRVAAMESSLSDFESNASRGEVEGTACGSAEASTPPPSSRGSSSDLGSACHGTLPEAAALTPRARGRAASAAPAVVRRRVGSALGIPSSGLIQQCSGIRTASESVATAMYPDAAYRLHHVKRA